MDKQRQKFVDELNRLKEARQKTKSYYLIKDYSKQIKQMEKDLKTYDNLRKNK